MPVRDACEGGNQQEPNLHRVIDYGARETRQNV
jgi:hypothetical protein